MKVAAHLKNIRLSSWKARLVVNQVRGKTIEQALNTLRFSRKKAAHWVKKTLESAIANAEHNFGADLDELKISEIYVDEASRLKRTHARAKGRSNRILKPTCHITVKITTAEDTKQEKK